MPQHLATEIMHFIGQKGSGMRNLAMCNFPGLFGDASEVVAWGSHGPHVAAHSCRNTMPPRKLDQGAKYQRQFFPSHVAQGPLIPQSASRPSKGKPCRPAYVQEYPICADGADSGVFHMHQVFCKILLWCMKGPVMTMLSIAQARGANATPP